MRDFARIHRAWLESDAQFVDRRGRARSPASRANWDRQQQLNDYAYFILLFAQFEDRVNELALRLIT